MNDSQDTLTLQEIREIFLLNRGEAKAMAARLGKSETTISLVLRGKTTSRAVLTALRARAKEIRESDHNGVAA